MDANTAPEEEMAQFPPPQQSSQSKVGKSPRPPSQLQSSMRQVQGREVPVQMKMSFFCVFFLYLMSIPVLFTVFYHNYPVLVLSFVTGIVLCSLMPMSLNKGEVVVRGNIAPMISAAMLASIMMVFFISVRVYYAHVQPLNALMTGREYHNVWPEQPSVSFQDAAYLNFAGDTKPDVAKSISLHSVDTGYNTFCVAPITSSGHEGRLEFFAAGTNCCSDGKFECGDAGKAGVKSGWVMPKPNDHLYNLIGKYVSPAYARRDLFVEALVKAEFSKGLVAPEEPMFVNWSSQTQKEIIADKRLLVVMSVLGLAGLAAVLAIGLMMGQVRFVQLRIEYKLKRFGQNGMATSERLNEFIESMDQSDVLGLAEARQPLDVVWDTWFMRIIVPYMVLMICTLLTTYGGCYNNSHMVIAPLLSMLAVMILALLATPNRAMIGLMLMLMACTGLYIGNENYKYNMSHYCASADRRTYTDVKADANSHEYADAGILQFDSSATLSQKDSVGFLYQGYNYCAAPIIHDNCAAAKDAAKGTEKKGKKEEKKDDKKKAVEKTEEKKTEKKTEAKTEKTAAVKTDEKAGMTIFTQAENKIEQLFHRQPKALSFVQTKARMRRGALVVDDDDDSTDDTSSLLQQVVAPAECKSAEPQRIEFWAVGLDCCDSRGNFNCDGGQDKSAHAGAIVKEKIHGETPAYRSHYHKAIAMSAAVRGVADPEQEHVVFIRWGKDPKALQQEWNSKAQGILVFTGIAGLLSVLLVGLCCHAVLRNGRVRERKARTEEQERLDAELKKQGSGGKAGAAVRSALNV